MFISTLTAIILPLLCTPNIGASPYKFIGKVTSVISGDTIEILDTYNKKYIIYLAAIDCPEKHQEFGPEASEFTRQTLQDKSVYIRTLYTNTETRKCVAYVFLRNGTCINQMLLENGLAWWNNDRIPGNYLFKNIEKNARMNKKGLWKNKNAVPPKEFRKLRKYADDKYIKKIIK